VAVAVTPALSRQSLCEVKIVVREAMQLQVAYCPSITFTSCPTDEHNPINCSPNRLVYHPVPVLEPCRTGTGQYNNLETEIGTAAKKNYK